MRDYLDGILSFIGTDSLTDDEFLAITLTSYVDQVAVYHSLLETLESREAVSFDMSVRLQSYFIAKGVQVIPVQRVAQSNIFFGASLE